ncbi:YolD-like family protein [Peribacillus loiseleuriae]|uniref:YolD-like family protein n=1 Tax=Peribacillus loiseleuriae TaxID=1679170 RepID=UPI0038237744
MIRSELLKKTVLEEQVYKQIGIAVMESLNYTLPVRIIFWQADNLVNNIGIVSKVDRKMKYLILDLLSGEIKIELDCIIAVERYNHD